MDLQIRFKYDAPWPSAPTIPNYFDERQCNVTRQHLFCTVLYCTVLYCTSVMLPGNTSPLSFRLSASHFTIITTTFLWNCRGRGERKGVKAA